MTKVDSSSEQEFVSMRITGGTLEALTQLGADPEDPYSVERAILRTTGSEHQEETILKAIRREMDEYKFVMPAKRMLELHRTLTFFAEVSRIATIEMLLQDGFTGYVGLAEDDELDKVLEGYA